MTNPSFYLSDLGVDRLKTLRDGVEDYVYYTLLEKLVSEKKDVDMKIILENVKTFLYHSECGRTKVRTYVAVAETADLSALAGMQSVHAADAVWRCAVGGGACVPFAPLSETK